MHYSIVHYTTQHNAIQYNTVNCSTIQSMQYRHYNTIQCSKIHYSIILAQGLDVVTQCKFDVHHKILITIM